MAFRLNIWLLLVFTTISSQLYGQNYGVESVYKTLPDSSKKWMPWILAEKDYLKCPFSAPTLTYDCAWFSTLSLNLNSSGGDFALRLETFADTPVTLPGNNETWPVNVTSNGSALAVTTNRGYPSVVLSPGVHLLVGHFSWKKLPESLKIPQSIALTRLTINDVPVSNQKLGSDGELWLGQTDQEDSSNKDTASLLIYRLYDDSIPSILMTRLDLDISGKAREIILGPILPNGFSVLSIDSNLPVQWTADGKIRIRGYAGKHQIEVVGRSLQKRDQITVPKLDDPIWPKKEFWAIKQNLDYREITIDLMSIDPSQTTFPDEWKKNSLYYLEQGTQIDFNPKDSDQLGSKPPDQLKIHREIWLDSNGQGFSIKDLISGSLQRSWRIDVLDGYHLGKATVNNENILVTQHNGKTGVEVRDSNLILNAEGRIDTSDRKISATGWENDFEKINIDLNLPPGWKLFTVTGTDSLSQSWLKQWNLMNIFVLCLITLATIKTLGLAPGFLAFFTLLLLIPEFDSPRWIWLILVTLVAFHKVFPLNGLWRKLLLTGEGFAILFFFIVLIHFSIDHLRHGLHPILENLNTTSDQYPGESASHSSTVAVSNQDQDSPGAGALTQTSSNTGLPEEAPTPPPIPVPSIPSAIEDKSLISRKTTMNIQFKSASGAQQEQQFEIYSSKAAIQTGYGIPDRSWNKIALKWDGPVSQKHKIHILVVPPFINGILSVLRVFLAIFLGYILIRGLFNSTGILTKRNHYA